MTSSRIAFESPLCFTRRRPAAASLGLAALLAAGLVACGENGENGHQTMSDAEYFGLVPGRCLGFRDAAGFQEVTVGVEGAHTIQGMETLEVRYRLNGNLRRAEFLLAEGGELRVVRREDPGTTDADQEFDPPYLISVRPLNATLQAPLRTTTTDESVYGTSESVEWDVRTSIEPSEMHDVPGQEEQVPSFKHFIDLVPDDGEPRNDVFSIAPELGFTRIDLHGADFPAVRLVAVWESETCGEIPID